MSKKSLRYWQEKLLPVYLSTPARENQLTRSHGNTGVTDIKKGGTR